MVPKYKILDSLSETLDTELKDWLDLENAREAAELAIACIAMRNHGGGRIVIGIDAVTIKPSIREKPSDLVKAYNSDKINVAVGKYSLPKFEVRVDLQEYLGSLHPVIIVDGGVQFPVITKAQCNNIRQNVVIMRSVENGYIGSTEPKSPADWERLLKHCFDNRDADIATYLKRHLPSILEFLKGVLNGEFPSDVKSHPRHEERVLMLLNDGFSRAIKRSDKSFRPNPFKQLGTRESAFYIDGDFPNAALMNVLQPLFHRQPQLTGWPPWVDSRQFSDIQQRPYTSDSGWEALVYTDESDFAIGMLDFWRISTDGSFYQVRTLEDDTARSLKLKKKPSRSMLDFYLVIARTAEIIVTARQFAEALGTKSDARLQMGFRWKGLAGRELGCWTYPERKVITAIRAVDDEVVVTLAVDINVAASEIKQYTKVVAQKVFDLFGFQGEGIVDQIVDKTLKGDW